MKLTLKSIDNFINGVVSNSPPEQKQFILKAGMELKKKHIDKTLTVKTLLSLNSVESLTVFHCLNHYQQLTKNEYIKQQNQNPQEISCI